jgi:hypothetical protein
LTSSRHVDEYVARLNRTVARASREERGRSCVIVDRIESGEGRRHDRYVLLGKRFLTS